jgi:hypothetical protein
LRFLPTLAQRSPNDLHCDQEGRQGGDPSKDPECDREGLDRSLDLPFVVLSGGIEAGRQAAGCRSRDLVYQPGDLVRARHLDSRFGVVDTAPKQLAGQRRGEIAQSSASVDVVGHNVRHRQAYANKPHLDPPIGLHFRSAERGQVGLAVGVKPHRDDLADVKAVGRCGRRRGHKLVHPGWISSPSRTEGESVNREVLATHAPLAGSCFDREQTLGDGGAVGP